MTEIARRDFLVSIRPLYAEKIINGAKTVELRRRFVNEIDPGAVVLIYSSSPIQAIVGYAAISGVQRLPIEKMWRKHAEAACIRRRDFDSYFAGLEVGYAILLGTVRRFRQAFAAAELRKRFGFVPPQSFRYLPEAYYALLKHEQLQGSY